MSFQKYLQVNHSYLKKKKFVRFEFAVSPYEEYPFLKKIIEPLKRFFFLHRRNFVQRYLQKYPHLLSKIFGKRKIILKVSKNSIVVEEKNFEKALELAVLYFGVAKIDDILWKKIYYSEPEKSKQIDGFKFINVSKEKDIIRYVMEGDIGSTAVYLPVELEVRRDGKYLMYHSEIANKKLIPGFTKYLLTKLNVKPTRSLVNKISSNPKKWFRVGDWTPDSGLDAKGKVFYDEDKLNAYLKVEYPSKEGKIFDQQDMDEILENSKISYGINKELIETILKKKRYGEPLLLASGIAKKDGTDTIFDEVYLKNYKDIQIKANKLHVFLVQKGEILIRKKDPTFGVAGINVFGETIHASDGIDKDIRKIAGKNTTVSEDGKEIISTISGHVYRQNGQWTVQEILELEEVSHKTGNINHVGTVIVHGSVFDGYAVTAAASILVKESVGACTLEAKGDIEITLGVSGKKRARIISEYGVIHAKFFQDCFIKAKGSISSDKLISGCKIYSEKSVEVRDEKGSIWGGEIYAYNKVEAENIGAISGRKVFISVGILPEIREKIDQLQNEKEDKVDEIKQFKDDIINEQSMVEKKNMGKKLEMMKSELSIISNELDQFIEQTKTATTEAEVLAHTNLFSSVTIQIDHIIYENKVFKKKMRVFRDPENLDELKMEKLDNKK